jgi:hypothetical protein
MESFGIPNLNDLMLGGPPETNTIKQGMMFNERRKRNNANALAKIKAVSFANNVSSSFKEGFESGQNISEKTQSEISALLELERLKAMYDELIKQQQSNQTMLSTRADMYITSNTTENIYAGKNVLLKKNEALGYVTPKGVFKWYPTWDIINSISGKNGCPVLRSGEASDYVLLEEMEGFNLWTAKEGSVIRRNPRIVLGKAMISGQSCGNENTNVYVSGTVPPPVTYSGCYKDSGSRTMTYQNEGYVFDYESCRQRAIDTGSQYFAMQDYQTSSKKAQCFVGNDYNKAISLGSADSYPNTSLWSSTTGVANGYAMLKNDGNIYGYDPKGRQVYNTMTGTAECAPIVPTNISATWGGNDERAVAGNATSAVQSFNNGTQSFSYKIGLSNMRDPTSGRSNTFDISYQCGDKIKSQHVRAESNNRTVVLDCTDSPLACSCYLMLKDDGEMVIYKGVSPGPNDPVIFAWPKYDVSNSVPHPSYPQNLSKTGANWISANIRLNKVTTHEYVVSDDGKLLLFVGDDGNMWLNTFTLKEGCPKRHDGKAYGGGWANSLYSFDTAINSEYNGKIGYIDDAGELREYTGDTIGYKNTYKKYAKYDSGAGSYLSSLKNSTPSACKTACNNMDNCAGIVFDDKTKTCYTKDNKIFPKSARTPSADYDLYVRNLKVNNSNSCSKNIVDIDSNMWKGYTQGAPMDKDEVCGLGKVLEDPHDKMDEIQKQIDDVVEKMKDIFSQLQQDNVKLTKDMLDLQRRIDEDLNEYNNVNKSIEERQTAQTTINSMLSDSHLVVLKENYKYTFFSVVAIGALIIAMSVGKKMT